jgi:glycine/D-amino acid oxidase-like deaminating enzyme
VAEGRVYELAVIGGGLAGAAIAYGLRSLGSSLALLDEGDAAYRAARGNFGLIWVQGKGQGLARYGSWTRRSASDWPALAASLRQETGLDVALSQPGGLHVCASRAELDARERMFAGLFAQPGFERYDVEMLDRAAVARRLPGVGEDVVGGTWSALDGHCNPLRLLRALHRALQLRAVACRYDHAVTAIERKGGRFSIATANGAVEAERIVLSAGLGNARLAPMVGLSAPVTPNKGHVVVLERVTPFLSFPLENIRQTDEGAVLLGDSQQDRGFDETLGLDVLGTIARRALAILPALRDVRVVRAWAALRVMTPDTFPIYEESREMPGAFLVTSHSGVTLAAVHALVLAPAILEGALPADLAPFSARRFDHVRAAA